MSPIKNLVGFNFLIMPCIILDKRNLYFVYYYGGEIRRVNTKFGWIIKRRNSNGLITLPP